MKLGHEGRREETPMPLLAPFSLLRLSFAVFAAIGTLESRLSSKNARPPRALGTYDMCNLHSASSNARRGSSKLTNPEGGFLRPTERRSSPFLCLRARRIYRCRVPTTRFVLSMSNIGVLDRPLLSRTFVTSSFR